MRTQQTPWQKHWTADHDEVCTMTEDEHWTLAMTDYEQP